MNAARHRDRRPRLSTVILVALAIAMIAGTVAVACLSRNQEPEPPRRDRATAEPEAEPEAQPGAEPDPEQEQEQEPEPTTFGWPTDIVWERVAGIDLPVSATDGPHNRNLGRAKEFGRTQAGAVLAALHLIVRTSYQVGRPVWEPTLRDQVVGPDAAAYTDEVRADQGKGDRIYAVILGVRLDSYVPEAASMRVLIKAATGTAAALTQVTWKDDDWRLVAPPNGDWSTVRTPAPADYTPLPAR